MTAPRQCQAIVTLDGLTKPARAGERCPSLLTKQDPRGPWFCWVHGHAFNNGARAYPLRLDKSVTDERVAR